MPLSLHTHVKVARLISQKVTELAHLASLTDLHVLNNLTSVLLYTD